MNEHTSLLDALRAESPHTRLKAARYFGKIGSAADLHQLRLAHRRETVSYIKRGLEDAIRRIERIGPTHEAVDSEALEASVPEDVVRQIRAKSVEHVAKLLLHEVEKRVGFIALTASKELPNYTESKTKKDVEGLKDMLEAIRTLTVAASAPRVEEFELDELIGALVRQMEEQYGIKISRYGQKGMVVRSGKQQLELAFLNGLKNAVEAVVVLDDREDSHRVVVNWGETDVEYWVSIVDHGPGITGQFSKAFEFGHSTKADHLGVGLAVAKQAAESLQGNVTLSRATEGGTVFEIRWMR